MSLKIYFTIFFACNFLLALGNEGIGEVNTAWKSLTYNVISNHRTVSVTRYANIFSDSKNSITKLAPELVGLKAIKFPLNDSGLLNKVSATIKLSSRTNLVIGIFRDSAKQDAKNVLSSIDFGAGKVRLQPVLTNAISITGMPAVDIYVVEFSRGVYTVKYPGGVPWMILGAISAIQEMIVHDAGMADGRLWEPFIIEGFYDEKPLFEIIGGPGEPVIDEGMEGTEGIQGGFEGGAIVKIGTAYHMFPTERAGREGMPAYYDRVKTRIGHWTSTDAKKWKRVSTIYQASGVYAITDDDNPMNDRRGAIWSYIPVFNTAKNKWFGYYLTYTVHREIEPNHSFGRIWQTESKTAGPEGIGGPYGEGKLIMEPGLNSQLWEGRQGVASFFPYRVGDQWLGFYSGAYPYLKKEDYPAKSGKGWFVGLAKADSLEGPWTRFDTTVNPVKSIHPWFVENPIVYQMPNGLYLAIFDGGPEGWGHHLPNMIGYATSKDGYKWSEARYLPIDTKVKKWWNIMRTPLCLVQESGDVYTIVYAAINEKRFHPIGMVQLKLDRDVLDSRMKTD